ncbi:MAG: PilZ domain-containing protein [Pseudomonadota bacterium]
MTKIPGFMERRRYFRIEDRVRLRLSLLTAEECQERLRVIRSPSPLTSALMPLRQRLSQTLKTLVVETPEIAEGMKLLDEKIEILAHWLDGGQDISEAPLRSVSLSANGLACDVVEPFATQSHLEIRLAFLPSLRLIRTLARVVVCDPLPAHAKGYRLHMVFLELGEADREFLIRHVLHRQGEWLRSQPQEA